MALTVTDTGGAICVGGEQINFEIVLIDGVPAINVRNHDAFVTMHSSLIEGELVDVANIQWYNRLANGNLGLKTNPVDETQRGASVYIPTPSSGTEITSPEDFEMSTHQVICNRDAAGPHTFDYSNVVLQSKGAGRTMAWVLYPAEGSSTDVYARQIHWDVVEGVREITYKDINLGDIGTGNFIYKEDAAAEYDNLIYITNAAATYLYAVDFDAETVTTTEITAPVGSIYGPVGSVNGMFGYSMIKEVDGHEVDYKYNKLNLKTGELQTITIGGIDFGDDRVVFAEAEYARSNGGIIFMEWYTLTDEETGKISEIGYVYGSDQGGPTKVVEWTNSDGAWTATIYDGISHLGTRAGFTGNSIMFRTDQPSVSYTSTGIACNFFYSATHAGESDYHMWVYVWVDDLLTPSVSRYDQAFSSPPDIPAFGYPADMGKGYVAVSSKYVQGGYFWDGFKLRHATDGTTHATISAAGLGYNAIRTSMRNSSTAGVGIAASLVGNPRDDVDDCIWILGRKVLGGSWWLIGLDNDGAIVKEYDGVWHATNPTAYSPYSTETFTACGFLVSRVFRTSSSGTHDMVMDINYFYPTSPNYTRP